MAESIKLYEDEIRTLLSIPDKERGQVVTALFRNCLHEEIPELNPMENAVFSLVSGQVRRAEELSNKRKASANSRWHSNANKEHNNASPMQNNANPENDNAKSCTYTNTTTNTNTSTITNTPPTPSNEDGETTKMQGQFDRFWATYPKKTAKQNALKAWQKLNPDDKLTEEILLALEQQKKSVQWQKDNGQFIPYPATWLNGKRWEDIIDPEDGKGASENIMRSDDSNEHSYDLQALVDYAMNNTPKIKTDDDSHH